MGAEIPMVTPFSFPSQCFSQVFFFILPVGDGQILIDVWHPKYLVVSPNGVPLVIIHL
jgi:hypothetical protein